MARLAERVRYCANRNHKLKMFDGKPGSARPHKTACDRTRVNTQEAAEQLIGEAIRRGMISTQRRGAWPQNVWGVDEMREVYQANLSNSEKGEYHGFPIRREGSFLNHIRSEWLVRAP